MSQNVKYTEYTIISGTDIPNKKRVAVFQKSEMSQMLDYIISEIHLCDMKLCIPVIITRETTTKNFHEKVGGFKKQKESRLRRIEIWNKDNRGLFNWLHGR